MNLGVVTYTTDFQHPAVKYLIESMRHWKWPEPVIVGGGISFMGHIGKMRDVKTELPKMKARGFTHALYTDAWDVVCTGPFEEIRDFTGALLSADAGCWSDQGNVEPHMFPDTGTRWKYVNGGGWMGEIDFLLDVVLKDSERELWNDQFWLSKKWFNSTPGLLLDSKCEVFQCLSQTPRESLTVEGERVVNLETGTKPLLIHGAGGTDMSWVPCIIPWQQTNRTWVK